uniref:Uncharacterized protein n=1 Tax=Plectus sambesii TaxID=2011161 RepID=A0A914UPB5_9BILA
MMTTNLSILCLLFAGAQVMAQQMTFPGSSRPFNNNNNNMNGL